jgi:tetratricopeptide (TPR) repeat protein
MMMRDMATLHEALTIALAEHQRGNLRRAEELYRQVVAAEPANVAAWHLLGTLAYQAGNYEAAAECLGRAVELNPRLAEAHNNLGLVRREQGKLEDAAACFWRAIGLKRDYAEAHYNLGNVLNHQGAREEAAALYRRAIEQRPEYVEAHDGLGTALHGQGQLDEAIASYRRAVELRPNYAEGHSNLGSALHEQGKLQEAAACYCRALALKPDLSRAWFNLGTVLKDEEKLDEAAACYRRALELRPDQAETYRNLGLVLHEQGKLDEATACYERAVQLDPQYANAHLNLGNERRQRGHFQEAKVLYRQALAARPDFAGGRLDDATLKLLEGDFARGFAEYEWRWKTKQLPQRELSQPRWEEEALAGRTILLWAEQGLGDTIQFIRYAKAVKSHGATVLLECPPAIMKLLAGCAGIDRLIAMGDELPAFDFHAPLLSLPRILGTTLENVPSEVPYLLADAALIDAWRARLARVQGFRIGINWHGREGQGVFRNRDIPVECFARLERVPGVRLISLQKGSSVGCAHQGARQDEVGEAHPTILSPGDDFDESHGAFMDTVAIMKHLGGTSGGGSGRAGLGGAAVCPRLAVALGPQR